jgi:hypothetical protein
MKPTVQETEYEHQACQGKRRVARRRLIGEPQAETEEACKDQQRDVHVLLPQLIDMIHL